VPVLVDFWAPWCGPCRSLKPLLEKLAGEYGGRFELAKLNSDEAPSVSARYAVRSIPAVKLFVDGEVVDEFTGALPEGQLRAFLDARLPDEAEELRRRRPPWPTRWPGPSCSTRRRISPAAGRRSCSTWSPRSSTRASPTTPRPAWIPSSPGSGTRLG
jgi:putative thioredoxin